MSVGLLQSNATLLHHFDLLICKLTDLILTYKLRVKCVTTFYSTNCLKYGSDFDKDFFIFDVS